MRFVLTNPDLATKAIRILFRIANNRKPKLYIEKNFSS
jgi:hypothetical protein